MVSNVPAILHLPTIQQYLRAVDLIPVIEQGFVAYSKGNAIVPPVGELLLTETVLGFNRKP